VYLDQLTITDMDSFYASWTDGIRGRAKKLDRLKGFVKFCVRRKWLTEDIASHLEPPAGSSITLPKAPFTDNELARIYAACASLALGRRNWTGEDAKDFIDLSLYTGLRISDVATFDISKRLGRVPADAQDPPAVEYLHSDLARRTMLNEFAFLIRSHANSSRNGDRRENVPA
jgi:hypothetical protein